ncbi:MAG: EAL domain-containing protein [Bryobacterales bacterium]|nr:EAL domain-containing protein [Bryobacterales bacterium]
MFVVSASPAAEARDSALERIAALAARLMDVPVAAVYSGSPNQPTLRATAGPAGLWEHYFRETLADSRCQPSTGRPLIITDTHFDPRLRASDWPVRSIIAVTIPAWNGAGAGALLAAAAVPHQLAEHQLLHLTDLATLAGNELELERRRSTQAGASVERRKTQEQLLEKTLELAKFSEDLRQLHRLSTTNYETIDDLLQDYLQTGSSILGLGCGVVMQTRGRYGSVRAARCEVNSVRPGLTFELSQVHCGLVCEEKQTLAVGWVSEDPRLVSRPHYGPVRQAAYIGTPILIDGEVYGVLSFSSPHVRWTPFGSHEIEIIELMAKSVARSIHEGRLQSARERSETLEQDRSQALEMVAKDQPLIAVLTQIARMVERQAPSVAIAIHLVSDERVFCCAAPSMPEPFRKRFQSIPLQHGRSCCFSAAYSRLTEVYETAAPRCAPHGGPSVHEFCWQVCGASPILSGSGELLGLLIAYSKVAVQPRFVDTELLEMAGSLSAIAIEHRRLTDRLAFHAMHDVLTSLPNRTMLSRSLDEFIVRAKDRGLPFAVVFVDLDRFKQINDHYGHAAGDTVLREIAARLKNGLFPGEVIARLGGDEFVAIWMEKNTDAAHARSLKLLDSLRSPIHCGSQLIYVTASIGISIFPQSGITADALLASADQAMYRVKSSGRNDAICYAPELEGGHQARLQLSQALRRAIENEEFELNFQPIVDIRRTGSILLAGFEVLLAWKHDELGRISPSQFIPLAEECGLIGVIGAWVLRKACEECVRWQRAGYEPVPISVNVSALQFGRADFVDTVESTLKETGLEGRYIELELTESAIMQEIAAATAKLKRLRALGVRLALDDFGTGYSALGYLRWIPVDCLKIDQSFLAELETSEGAYTLVQTIVALADNMGLSVVAEGVETERQLEMLREIGCDKAQGHLIGASLPRHDVESWLARDTKRRRIS